MLNCANIFGLSLFLPASVLYNGWNLIYHNSLTLCQVEEKWNTYVFPFHVVFWLFFNRQYSWIHSYALVSILFLLLPKIRDIYLLTIQMLWVIIEQHLTLRGLLAAGKAICKNTTVSTLHDPAYLAHNSFLAWTDSSISTDNYGRPLHLSYH